MSFSNNDQYESMSIASFGASTLLEPKYNSKSHTTSIFGTDDNIKQFYQTKITNYIDDIDGATVKNKYERFCNKTLPNLNDQYSLMNESISSHKKILKNTTQIRDTMNIDDIEGTRTRVKNGMVKTKRHVNPLEPNYDLPTYVSKPATPPKFLRDTLNIRDIKGTTPHILRPYETRDLHSVDDIEGTQSTVK